MIKVTKDGRTIRTDSDYTKFRGHLYQYQSGECFNCSRLTELSMPHECDESFHVHHVDGRGMGGSKRNDTLEACKGLYGKCHRTIHEILRAH